ncbi:MFS transporter [Alicyclobacillus sp. TC]|uniref:MFS transporter n=1 Tax=Alicyclobacillus sp. TC TaxID=2606450 RepID=UPI0019333A9F|nr:MFS transporter [Alicyclobacillus sp. TC]QRF22584.1 MFS transporter [Alicyclobacillus sp. TC]
MNWKSLHPNIRIRALVFFFVGVGQSTTIPFMGIYFAKAFGADLSGILLAVSMVLSLLASLFGAYFADRVGRRKILLSAEAMFVLIYLVMAMANSPWWSSATLTLIAFTLGNMCWGIYGPVDEAMILDVTNQESRAFVFTLFYWLMNLTLAIGSAIGAIFFYPYRFWLFLVMACVVFVNWWITYLLIAETYQPMPLQHGKGGLSQVRHTIKTILQDKAFLIYFFSTVAVATVENELPNDIGVHLLRTFQPVQLHVWHWMMSLTGISVVGFLQTENTMIVVCLASLAVFVSRRMSKKRVLLLGIGLNTVGFALQCFFTNATSLFFLMAVATVGEIFNVPVRQSFVGDIAPDDGKTMYLALMSVAWGLGRVLASASITIGAHLSGLGMAILVGMMGGLGLFGFYRLAQKTETQIHHARLSSDMISFREDG